MNWFSIESEEDWQKAMEASFHSPVVVFKHSTRCGISAMVKRQFEREWNYQEDEILPFLLDLLQHRSISNRIAMETGVYHESPQLILLRNGKAIHHASHNSIDALGLLTQIQSLS